MSKLLTPEQYRRQNKKTPVLDANYKYIKVKEYAAMTGQHIVTVYKNLDRGIVEGAVKSGRTWLIPIKK